MPAPVHLWKHTQDAAGAHHAHEADIERSIRRTGIRHDPDPAAVGGGIPGGREQDRLVDRAEIAGHAQSHAAIGTQQAHHAPEIGRHALERHRAVIDQPGYLRIEPHGQDGREVPVVHFAQVGRPGMAPQQDGRRLLSRGGDTHRPGEIVASAARQDAEGDVRPRQRVHHFVHGSVASAGGDAGISGIHGFGRECLRIAPRRGRTDIDRHVVRGQRLPNPLGETHAAPAAGIRIRDDERFSGHGLPPGDAVIPGPAMKCDTGFRSGCTRRDPVRTP